MLEKSLDEISPDDVKAFFALKLCERKRIEYKRELHRLDIPEQKLELLRDVTSLANSEGGHLIFGIDADDGEPTQLLGAKCDNPDAAKTRMQEIIRAGTDPRLAFEIHHVAADEPGRHVFILRIDQSLQAPHAVVPFDKKGIREFWLRHTTGKAAMDTAEIRHAFVFSETIIERMRAFRRKRARHIHTGERTPLYVGAGAKCVLHLVPLAAFRLREPLSLEKMQANARKFPPLLERCGGGVQRINLDGLANSYGGGFKPDEPCLAYTQIYRNGIVEAVLTDIVKSDLKGRLVDALACERMLLRGLHTLPRGLKALAVPPPVWCFVSVTGVHGATINGYLPIDRNELYLPEFEITDLQTECKPLAERCATYLWNAGGFDTSRTFAALADQFDEHWDTQ